MARRYSCAAAGPCGGPARLQGAGAQVAQHQRRLRVAEEHQVRAPRRYQEPVRDHHGSARPLSLRRRARRRTRGAASGSRTRAGARGQVQPAAAAGPCAGAQQGHACRRRAVPRGPAPVRCRTICLRRHCHGRARVLCAAGHPGRSQADQHSRGRARPTGPQHGQRERGARRRDALRGRVRAGLRAASGRRRADGVQAQRPGRQVGDMQRGRGGEDDGAVLRGARGAAAGGQVDAQRDVCHDTAHACGGGHRPRITRVDSKAGVSR